VPPLKTRTRNNDSLQIKHSNQSLVDTSEASTDAANECKLCEHFTYLLCLQVGKGPPTHVKNLLQIVVNFWRPDQGTCVTSKCWTFIRQSLKTSRTTERLLVSILNRIIYMAFLVFLVKTSQILFPNQSVSRQAVAKITNNVKVSINMASLSGVSEAHTWKSGARSLTHGIFAEFPCTPEAG
jgi:hypothetical protein